MWLFDTRPPEEIIAAGGFFPKSPNSNTTLRDFVHHNADSPFVASSRTPRGAIAGAQQPNGWLYKIENPGGGLDVRRLGGDNIFYWESEIAFTGGTPLNRVVSAEPNRNGWYVGTGNTFFF